MLLSANVSYRQCYVKKIFFFLVLHCRPVLPGQGPVQPVATSEQSWSQLWSESIP